MRLGHSTESAMHVNALHVSMSLITCSGSIEGMEHEWSSNSSAIFRCLSFVIHSQNDLSFCRNGNVTGLSWIQVIAFNSVLRQYRLAYVYNALNLIKLKPIFIYSFYICIYYIGVVTSSVFKCFLSTAIRTKLKQLTLLTDNEIYWNFKILHTQNCVCIRVWCTKFTFLFYFYTLW